MAARKVTHEISALERGDWEAPNVLAGLHEVPVELPAGTLHPERPASAAELHERCAVGYLPAWMEGFQAHALAAISDTLGALRRPNDTPKGPFRFDPFHRLDEWTFVGEPAGKLVPLLAVTPGPEILDDNAGRAFAKMLALSSKAGGDPEQFFQIKLLPAEAVAEMYRSRPGVVLQEQWRLVSFFQGVGVGRAVGSVALLPKEERELKAERSTESELSRTARQTVIDKLTEKTTRKFSKKFNRVQRRGVKRDSSATWSSSVSRSLGDSTFKRSSEGKNSLSVENFRSLTMDVVRELVNDRTQDTAVTLHTEVTRKSKTKDTHSSVFKIKNDTDQPVTYVYHQMIHGYRTLLELVDVVAVLHDTSISSRPVLLPLDGALGPRLEELPGIGKAKAATIAKAVSAALRERYKPLGFVLPGAEPIVERAGATDPEMELFSRAALLGPRRAQGALPLTIQTIDSALQTDDLHVVTYVSQHAMPAPRVGT